MGWVGSGHAKWTHGQLCYDVCRIRHECDDAVVATPVVARSQRRRHDARMARFFVVVRQPRRRRRLGRQTVRSAVGVRLRHHARPAARRFLHLLPGTHATSRIRRPIGVHLRHREITRAVRIRRRLQFVSFRLRKHARTVRAKVAKIKVWHFGVVAVPLWGRSGTGCSKS